MVSSFQRTISVDVELGRRYGVVEVYMHSDESAVNFSYLDQTGKIRPVPLIIDSGAVEPFGDEKFLREEVKLAIPEAIAPVSLSTRERQARA